STEKLENRGYATVGSCPIRSKLSGDFYIGRKQGCVNASIKHKMASKTAVFFLLLAFWGILDIKAASVTSYKKDTWVDRLADSDGSKRTANEDREESDYNAEGDVAFGVDGVSDYYDNALENREGK
ncbi:unnamed protein product, partial [Porites lobata]